MRVASDNVDDCLDAGDGVFLAVGAKNMKHSGNEFVGMRSEEHPRGNPARDFDGYTVELASIESLFNDGSPFLNILRRAEIIRWMREASAELQRDQRDQTSPDSKSQFGRFEIGVTVVNLATTTLT